MSNQACRARNIYITPLREASLVPDVHQQLSAMALQAKITGAEKFTDQSGEYTAYKIDIAFDGERFSTYRRYSQFHELHNAVKMYLLFHIS